MAGLYNDIVGGPMVAAGESVVGKLTATLGGKALEVAYTLVRPAA